MLLVPFHNVYWKSWIDFLLCKWLLHTYNTFQNYIKIKIYIFNYFSKKTLQAVILLFPNCPIFEKVWYNPLCFIVPEYNPRGSGGARYSLLSVWFSLFCSVCLSVVVVSFDLIRKLRMYALGICHSILIHMYENKQTYIDSHLPKWVITN